MGRDHKSIFDGRVDRLMEKVSSDGMTMCLIRTEESSSHNVFYFSGFSGSEGFLALTPDQRQIGTDSRYWTQAGQQSPFDLVKITPQNAKTLFPEICKGHKKIGYESATTSVRSYESLREKLDNHVELIPIDGYIEALRSVKDDTEISLLQRAQKIAQDAFIELLNEIRPGRVEKELAAHLEFLMKMKGADDISFGTILASGYRSALPHGRASEKVLEAGEMVVVDFGCVADGYVSDITRTVALGPIETQKEEVYGIVLEAQKAALNAAKAGMTGLELDRVARDVIQTAGFGDFFGHGLGHGMGLQGHEPPSVSFKNSQPLPLNSVVTIEPGIYLEGKFGVRIEDDVVLKEDGILNLTSLSKELLILP